MDENRELYRKRVKYATKNMAFGSLLVVVTTIYPLIIRTVLIKYWGLEYAGLNSLFSAILNAISISELGIGEALIYSLYKPMAENDVQKANALLKLYRKVYFIIGCGVFVIGILLIPFLPHLISGTYPSDINIYIIYFVYIINAVSGYWIFNYCNAIFLTNQATYRIDGGAAVNLVVIYTLQICVIIFTHNYYIYISLLPIGSITARLFTYWQKRKYFSSYVPAGKIEKSELPGFGKRIVGAAIRKIRTSVRGSIDSVVISAFEGLVNLAKYQNYMLILTVPQIIIGVINKAILQSLGNSISMENKESNHAVIKLYTFLTQWVGTWFATMLGVLYHPFIVLWIGAENTYPYMIEILFAIYFYLVCMTQITDLIRNSTGIWWEGKWIPILESLVNLILDIFLVQKWGIAGVILATIISIIGINIPCETWCVYKFYLEKKPIKELGQYILNFFECMVIILCSLKICQFYEATSIKDLFIRTTISIMVPNILFFIFHIKSKEMWEIINLAKGVLKNLYVGIKKGER